MSTPINTASVAASIYALKGAKRRDFIKALGAQQAELIGLKDIRRQLFREGPGRDAERAAAFELPFTDRDSYLTWLASWKHHWHQQVEAIRAAKAEKDQSTRSTHRRLAHILLVMRRSAKAKGIALKAAAQPSA